jgi:hypothetical protein
MDADFICPDCGQTEHKLQGPHSFVNWHWRLNPGLAINETLLGQRVPTHAWTCETCDKEVPLRTWLRCPECGTFHNNMLWAKGNAFGHWLGLRCPECSGRIPAVRNLVALAVEWLSAPLWLVPMLLLRQRFVDMELARLGAMKGVAHAPPNWIKLGLVYFGGAMYLLLVGAPVTLALVATGVALMVGAIGPAELVAILGTVVALAVVMLPTCLVAGLLWGVIMKAWVGRKPAKPGAAAATPEPPRTSPSGAPYPRPPSPG